MKLISFIQTIPCLHRINCKIIKLSRFLELIFISLLFYLYFFRFSWSNVSRFWKGPALWNPITNVEYKEGGNILVPLGVNDRLWLECWDGIWNYLDKKWLPCGSLATFQPFTTALTYHYHIELFQEVLLPFLTRGKVKCNDQNYADDWWYFFWLKNAERGFQLKSFLLTFEFSKSTFMPAMG